MTLSQLPLSLVPQHRDQQLFSNHYLNSTLPMRSEWRALAPNASVAMAAITSIRRTFMENPIQRNTSLFYSYTVVIRGGNHSWQK